MTIRLIDIEAQKDFEREMEAYNLRVQDRMDSPGISNEPWPTMPAKPEPMVDSRDEGVRKMNDYGMATPVGGYGGSKADPCSYDPLDFDGTSQSAVKGFASDWQRNDIDGDMLSSDASPFKISKE